MGGLNTDSGLIIERFDLLDKEGLWAFLDRAELTVRPDQPDSMTPLALAGLHNKAHGRVVLRLGVVAASSNAGGAVHGYATANGVRPRGGGQVRAEMGDVYVTPGSRGRYVGAALIETMVGDFSPHTPVIDERDVVGRLGRDTNGVLKGFPPKEDDEVLRVVDVRRAVWTTCPTLGTAAIGYALWNPGT